MQTLAPHFPISTEQKYLQALMRILEICLSESLGGLELYFHRCCLHFFRSEHSLFSMVSPSSRLAQLAERDGISCQAIRQKGLLTMGSTAGKVARFIEKHQIDLVHVHHKHDLLLVALAKKFSGRKFSLIHTRQMQLPHKKKDLYHRFLYGSMDLLITITEQLKKDVLEKIDLPPEKVVCLYYGVKAPAELDKEDCAQQQNTGTAHDSGILHVGVFGRIEHLKGQHVIVEAARCLQEKGHTVFFHLYGDVTDQQYAQQLKEKIQTYGLREHIIFEGFHPDAPSLMHCMDIIVMPSLNETFGLTLIEAMRSGVAVIGTRYGGIPEIIDDGSTGLLFERENVEQLTHCLEQLITQPERRQALAQAGKNKADAVFDEATHFAKLTALFEKQVENLQYS